MPAIDIAFAIGPEPRPAEISEMSAIAIYLV
jgi:hypothetical protein